MGGAHRHLLVHREGPLHRVAPQCKLLATVQAIADEVGPIAAVFVDTVSRVLPGAEENLQKDMTLFVKACDAVRERFGDKALVRASLLNRRLRKKPNS